MKTILIIVRLLYSVAAAFEYGYSDAQTIISFDTSPDQTMILKIRDPKFSEFPDKLILIFESATFTYEFYEDGIIAMHTSSQTGDTFAVASAYSMYLPEGDEIPEYPTTHPTMKKVAEDFTESEEPVLLEDWMLQPAEWN